MVQIGVGAWSERGTPRGAIPKFARHEIERRRPAIRIHTRPRPEAPLPEGDILPAPAQGLEQKTDKLPQIRLQPIVARPLQPFVLRESACSYLECRAAGRRCIAAKGRPVDLGYQVAHCLGPRHESCRHYRRLHPEPRSRTPRRLAYAAAVLVMVGLLALAVLQAMNLGSSTAMGRMVGLG